MSRQRIYCGNNLYEVGNRRIGTPYECLKKGIGQGLNSDLTGFNPNYQAIVADNTYCGTGTPPAGKQMGTPTSCLRKGVGIGKKLQYERDGGQLPRPAPAPGVGGIPHEVVARYSSTAGGSRGGNIQSDVHNHTADDDCGVGGELVRAVGDASMTRLRGRNNLTI